MGLLHTPFEIKEDACSLCAVCHYFRDWIKAENEFPKGIKKLWILYKSLSSLQQKEPIYKSSCHYVRRQILQPILLLATYKITSISHYSLMAQTHLDLKQKAILWQLGTCMWHASSIPCSWLEFKMLLIRPTWIDYSFTVIQHNII